MAVQQARFHKQGEDHASKICHYHAHRPWLEYQHQIGPLHWNTNIQWGITVLVFVCLFPVLFCSSLCLVSLSFLSHPHPHPHLALDYPNNSHLLIIFLPACGCASYILSLVRFSLCCGIIICRGFLRVSAFHFTVGYWMFLRFWIYAVHVRDSNTCTLRFCFVAIKPDKVYQHSLSSTI